MDIDPANMKSFASYYLRRFAEVGWITWLIAPALLAVLLVGEGQATPVAVWSGPGPNACNLPGADCSQIWAESTLTEEQRVELGTFVADSPEPYNITLPAGTVVSSMAYFKDKAVMDRRGTVLLVDTPAVGWRAGDWTFARINACGNWSVSNAGQTVDIGAVPGAIAGIASGGGLPTTSSAAPSIIPSLTAGFLPTPFGRPTKTQQTIPTEVTEFEGTKGAPGTTPKTIVVTPIPLPVPGFLLLVALVALRSLNRFSNRKMWVRKSI